MASPNVALQLVADDWDTLRFGLTGFAEPGDTVVLQFASHVVKLQVTEVERRPAQPAALGVMTMFSKTAVAPTAEDLALAQQAADALHSARCLCGARKRADEEQPFCTRCTHKLPLAMRSNLNASFRDGFARYYADAKAYLEGLNQAVTRDTV